MESMEEGYSTLALPVGCCRTALSMTILSIWGEQNSWNDHQKLEPNFSRKEMSYRPDLPIAATKNSNHFQRIDASLDIDVIVVPIDANSISKKGDQCLLSWLFLLVV